MALVLDDLGITRLTSIGKINENFTRIEDGVNAIETSIDDVEARSLRFSSLDGGTLPTLGTFTDALGSIIYYGGTVLSPTVNYISASGVALIAEDLASGDSAIEKLANSIDLLSGSTLKDQAALTALSSNSLVDDKVYQVQDRNYLWDASSTATANGFDVVAHDTLTTGRFLLQADKQSAHTQWTSDFNLVWAWASSESTSSTVVLPDSDQLGITVSPGIHQGDGTFLEPNASFQSVTGLGHTSVIRNAPIRVTDFDSFYISDLYHFGDSGRTAVGLEFKSSVDQCRDFYVSNVKFAEWDVGIYFNSSYLDGVNQAIMIGNTITKCDVGFRGKNAYDSVIIGNKFRSNGTNNVLLDGGGQYKLVGNDMSSVTDGESVILRGTPSQVLVESYFSDNNITHGSLTDSRNIQSIETYNAGAQIKVTFANPHYLIPGYDECAVAGTVNYDGTSLLVDDVLSTTELVLDVPYVADEATGTLSVRYAGLRLDADATQVNTIYDMFFSGGHSNITRTNGRIRNVVFNCVRAWGAKTLGFFESDPDSVLFIGSGAGRPGQTTANSSAPGRTYPDSDMYWGGSAKNHGYIGMFGQLDPHGRSSGYETLDELHYGIKRPFEASGLAANNWAKHYVTLGLYAGGAVLGIGEKNLRTYLLDGTDPEVDDMIIQDGAMRVLSGPNNVNRVRVRGGDTGASPAIDAHGADTNIALTIKTKGTGTGRLTNGDGVNMVEWNNAGVSFNGASIHSKITIADVAGPMADADDETLRLKLNALLAELRSYGLID